MSTYFYLAAEGEVREGATIHVNDFESAKATGSTYIDEFANGKWSATWKRKEFSEPPEYVKW